MTIVNVLGIALLMTILQYLWAFFKPILVTRK